MPLANGEVFAGYRILRLLGSGGMGEVYLAQHPRLPRRDALKILPADVSADGEFRERFLREADLAATLFHPHIVGVHDRGEDEGQLWISMDYIDGTDAARLMRDRYPAGMPADEVTEIVTAVASALDYAHQRRVLHRDVKPANILLSEIADDERRIFLSDLGIARSIGEVSGLTATNMAMGTLPYAAPEQLMGEPIDGRADQYSLAATAYHLLSGSPMFPHSNPAAVISRHLNTRPPALADIHPELAGLDPVLARALAKDPANRFTRCTDFARAFAAATQPGTQAAAAAPTMEAPVTTKPPASTVVAPKPPIGVSDSRPRWPITVAAIAVILLLLAVAFVVRPWQHDRATSGTTGTPTTVTPSITFDSMRDFVTAYYRDLPEHANDAWTKLDTNCQNQTGLRQYLDFWATIQSVTLVSVSPRDATSVIARLTYVRRDGQSDTEDRWFKMALVNGALLLDESQRNGAVESPSGTAASSTPAPPPQTTPTAYPGQTGPAVGSDCSHAQINTTTTSDTGAAIRCVSDPSGYKWRPDTGTESGDPGIVGQLGWDKCLTQFSKAKCIASAAAMVNSTYTSGPVFPDGVYRVPDTMNYGEYSARVGPAASCGYFIYDSSGKLYKYGTYTNGLDQPTVEINPFATNGTFKTVGCTPWVMTRPLPGDW
jgi:serine/threonine protein kinase